MLPIPICVPDEVKEIVYLLPGQKAAQKEVPTMENSAESSLMVPHGVCSSNRERKSDRLKKNILKNAHKKPKDVNLRNFTQ